DIRERIRERRMCGSIGAGAERRVAQVLEIQFFFRTVEVQTKTATDGELARTTGQLVISIGAVRKTDARPDVVVLCRRTTVLIATLISRKYIAKGCSWENGRLLVGPEAHARQTIVLEFLDRCIDLVTSSKSNGQVVFHAPLVLRIKVVLV